MSGQSKCASTKRDLEILVADLQSKLTLETEQRGALAAELDTAKGTITRLETELAETTQRAQDAAAAAAAVAAAAPPQAQVQDMPTIPKPLGTLRKLEELSGLSHADYKAIQRSVRNLAVRADLDVTQDFRRQSPESLAKLYKAAREEHLILKRFQNNWMTAELTKRFLQKRRKHAVRQGYINRAFLKMSARGPARRRQRHDTPEV
ncbi:hypothetical protein K466DRAFT_568231 [Polyporus arcularius HHB13444]|uniref:Uncharacterized protein n=1 Tax=Polyporus arcularius HHB13444 TaxID=1314778 RepID=A0A5C3P0G3_9APHY|nr:hypothetical protein K466DRAFT_568231 [Polyporus arcularius HHB13444]